MKNLKPIFLAAILSLALSTPVYSNDGIVHTPGVTAPAPVETTDSTGNISTPGFADILLAVISLF